MFCGLGGWAEGLLAEGYDVTGYDIEAHDYGTGGYPGKPSMSGLRTNRKGRAWFEGGAATHGSGTFARKKASAMIAKIPFALSSHIARTFNPADQPCP